jgi:UPF0755 protein
MIKKIITFLILIAIILLIWFWQVLYTGNSVDGGRQFTIEAGQGVNEISQNLYEQDLIKNKFIFETWIWVKKAQSNVLAGDYVFPGDISISRLITTILNGPDINDGSVTLVEGWDRNMMAKYLEKQNIDSEEFLRISSDASIWASIYDFLEEAPSESTLEGFIFPDTYFINSDTSAEDLVIKTLNNFNQKIFRFREEVIKQDTNFFEVVTLASIIEREVPNSEDKKMIADIFLKRLEIGMALQSDATINFVTGKGMTQPTYADLEIDSPYNTYKHAGLPPGPISSPGEDSIEAVLYPTSNPYYFFLTSHEGEVIYSKTYEEHLDNKAIYLP